MAKPAAHIDWLQGNGSIGSRIETPAGALTLNGYSPGDTPKSKNFNYLLYYLDQWDRWAETEIDSLTTAVAGKQASGNYITGLTGEVTATGPGSAAATIAAGAITNAKVASNAAIQFSKMESLALSKIMVTSGTGVAAASAVDATQLNYLDVNASIQTQLDAKASTSDLATTNGNVSAVSTSLSFHTGASSGVHGVTGSVVGTTDAQVLTAKDVDGGTASDTSRLTLAKNSIASLIALTRKQGNSFYSTDMLKQVVDNGTTLEPLAPAAQAMGINLITNNSDAQGWSKTGTVFATPATTAVAGNLPLAGVTNTAIQFVATGSGTEATNYNSYSVTTPASMSGKLQVDFFLRPGTGFAFNEWTVSVYQGSTRQALSADSSSVCYIPNTSGRFTVSFDATASTAYTLRFARVSGTGSATLNVCNVFFGWPFVSQTAALGKKQTTTLTPNSAWGTAANQSYWIKQDGNEAIISGVFQVGTSTGVTANPAAISMPSGLTIDTSLLPATLRGRLGRFEVASSAGSALISSTDKEGVLFYDGTNNDRIAFSLRTTTTGYENTNASSVAANNSYIMFEARVPIAEWTGSGTVNLGQGAQVEYASNSNSTASTASDTSSFVYGPAGSLLISATPTGTSITRRVRFQYPIQVDDIIEFEISPDQLRWFPVPCASSVIGLVDSLRSDGTNTIGAGGIEYATGGTDVNVTFGKYRTGTTVAWTATGYWRVRKAKASSPVGFGLAGTDGSAGLYKPGQAPGYTGGAAIPAGCVGEMFGTQRTGTGGFSYSVSGTTALTSSVASLISTTLNKGIYWISYRVRTTQSDGSTRNGFASLRVGGTSVQAFDSSVPLLTNVEGSITHSLPVVITADGTTVAVYGQIASLSGSSSGSAQEMTIARFA